MIDETITSRLLSREICSQFSMVLCVDELGLGLIHLVALCNSKKFEHNDQGRCECEICGARVKGESRKNIVETFWME
jgi:hypothetical protein